MLPVIPRTKKTSNRLVSFGKPCWTCRQKPHHKVLPSEAFEQMQHECSLVWPVVRAALERKGVRLPIEGAVAIRALFYRDAERGDATGYMQALADILQELGVIQDDKYIAHWDGTRLLKDATKPRIELEIEVLEPGLFGGKN
jgi:Holliday junction resolvase RusA-like endonuclease